VSVKILIVDDHQIFRQGLRNLIETIPGMEVAGEADNGRMAVKLARTLTPDIVIIDINMPGMSGIDATKKIISRIPGIKIIGLSFYSNKEVVSKLFCAGASGYLSKRCDSAEFVKAIKTVIENRKYMSFNIAKSLKQYSIGLTPTGSQRTSDLSRREKEQLQQWVNGISTRESALQLDLSVKTVETYRRNIKRKLDAQNLTDLIRYAVREGLTTIAEDLP